MRSFYGGHRLVGGRSRFSQDGKVILTAAENGGLFVFSAFTSKRVARLIKYKIKSFDLMPENPTKICLLTDDGILVVWDYLSQNIECTQSMDVHQYGVIDMAVCGVVNSVFVSLAPSNPQKEGKIVRFHLPDLKLDPEFSIVQSLPCSLTLSPLGNYLCILPLDRTHHCVILQTADFAHPVTIKFPHQAKVVCFDPNNHRLAVAVEEGKILLYNISDISLRKHGVKHQIASTLHWHASVATALKFSSDGHHLFSIGEEGVLVTWRLRDLHKSFVPRIGLNAIDLDIHPKKESLFLIALQNNSLKLIDQANHKVMFALYGISPGLKMPLFRGVEACLQPVTGYLAIRSGHSNVQFYDLARDKHIQKLEVIQRKETSRTKYKIQQKHVAFEPYLQHFAFNKTSTVFVALVVRSRLVESESKTDLHFFHADSAYRPFTAIAEVLDPHKGKIASLAYSPVEDVAVTTSSKGNFRIWTPQTKHKARSWKCKAIGSHKGLPLGECCFSPDGSVLAIAHDSGVVLWEPVTLSLLGDLTLPHLKLPSNIQYLRFISQSDYLVACDPIGSLVVVWNLQTLTIHWAATLPARHLIVDPSSRKFAVSLHNEATENGMCVSERASVVVFDPAESTPCAVYSDICQPIQSLHFALPSTGLFAAGRQMENGVKHTHAPLAIMHSSRQYSIETETGPLTLSVDEEVELRDFQEMPSSIERAFGAAARQEEEDRMEVDKDYGQDRVMLNVKDWSKLPSHALPSVAVLCSNLLDQIVDKSGRT